jgi:hypothetical protein
MLILLSIIFFSFRNATYTAAPPTHTNTITLATPHHTTHSHTHPALLLWDTEKGLVKFIRKSSVEEKERKITDK